VSRDFPGRCAPPPRLQGGVGGLQLPCSVPLGLAGRGGGPIAGVCLAFADTVHHDHRITPVGQLGAGGADLAGGGLVQGKGLEQDLRGQIGLGTRDEPELFHGAAMALGHLSGRNALADLRHRRPARLQGALAGRLPGQDIADLLAHRLQGPGLGRFMLSHAQHQHVGVAELHQLAVSPCLEHILAKGGLTHLGVGGDALAPLAGDPARGEGGQAQGLGGGLQAVRLLVAQGEQLVGHVDETPLRQALAVFALHPVPERLEGLLLGRLDLQHLQDLEAAGALDRVTDLLHREPEQCLIHVRLQIASGDDAQLPARRGGELVIGVLPCECGEILPLAQAFDQLQGLLAGLLLGLHRTFTLGHLRFDQDMPCTAFLGLHIAVRLPLIELAQGRLVHIDVL
jgi:hypothetical protein